MTILSGGEADGDQRSYQTQARLHFWGLFLLSRPSEQTVYRKLSLLNTLSMQVRARAQGQHRLLCPGTLVSSSSL